MKLRLPGGYYGKGRKEIGAPGRTCGVKYDPEVALVDSSRLAKGVELENAEPEFSAKVVEHPPSHDLGKVLHEDNVIL